MLKELLEGKPLRHPLHPTLVHLPIGLFLLSLLFDLATWPVDAGTALVQGAFYTMLFGVIAALVAAVPGLVDWSDIRADHPAKKIATYHMLLNLLAVGLYAVNLGLRNGALDAARTPVLPLVLSLAGIGILSVSGYLGGRLVYDDGIAVGRHRRRTDTPRETIRVSSADSPDGFATVANADAIGDRETLRVEVDGKVMTIANLDGELYAFQEFCTHRYGPLSEGTFDDHQVMCPWHRSCFDVRSGQVTQGPAKVDLETYEVRIDDGKIRVRVPPETRGAEGRRAGQETPQPTPHPNGASRQQAPH